MLPRNIKKKLSGNNNKDMQEGYRFNQFRSRRLNAPWDGEHATMSCSVPYHFQSPWLVLAICLQPRTLLAGVSQGRLMQTARHLFLDPVHPIKTGHDINAATTMADTVVMQDHRWRGADKPLAMLSGVAVGRDRIPEASVVGVDAAVAVGENAGLSPVAVGGSAKVSVPQFTCAPEYVDVHETCVGPWKGPSV
jgi:hypothetical protein